MTTKSVENALSLCKICENECDFSENNFLKCYSKCDSDYHYDFLKIKKRDSNILSKYPNNLKWVCDFSWYPKEMLRRERKKVFRHFQ